MTGSGLSCLPLRTPTLPPATHTNCYRLGHTYVDPASPYPDEQARLLEWTGGRVDRILITHHHHDHVAGVAALAAATRAPVYAHVDARVDFPVEGRLHDGDRIDTGDGVLVCLHTPGHADGHLAFAVEGTDLLLAGDVVAGEGTIVLVPPEGHLGTYLASLRRLTDRPYRVLPAHGPELAGPAIFEHYLQHRAHRTNQVRQALVAGATNPAAIASRVYDGIPGVDLTLAALQVQAHLTWLCERGEVEETIDGYVFTGGT